jgi:hypothetical protein
LIAYHREVGRIYLSDRFINLEMVRDGFAWRYVRYDKAGESTAADCGPIPVRSRRGNGDRLGDAASRFLRARKSDALQPQSFKRCKPSIHRTIGLLRSKQPWKNGFW